MIMISLKNKVFTIVILFFFISCQQQSKQSTVRDVSKIRAIGENFRSEGSKFIFTDYLKARQLFQQGLDSVLLVVPKNDELVLRLYHNLGSSYFNEEKYDMALVYFDSVRINQPQPAIMWLQAHNDFKIGKCYYNLGDIDLAKLYLKSAIQVAPNYPKSRPIFPFILLEYAECLRRQGQYKEAIQVSQMAIDSSFMFPERALEDSLTYASAYL